MEKNKQNQLARQRIVEEVDRYFVGPGSSDEIIADSPWDFYHTGMLWPCDSMVSGEEADHDDGVESGDSAEGLLNMANCAQQSAMGISTQLKKISQQVTVYISWGEYFGFSEWPEKRDPLFNWKKERMFLPANAWQRVCAEKYCTLDVDVADADKQVTLLDYDGLEVRAVLRELEDALMLTVVLLNRRKCSPSMRRNRLIYQPELIVNAGDSCGFLGKVNSGHQIADQEYWLYELLYHDARQFAVGHGCSAEWEHDNAAVSSVSTAWIPRQIVAKASGDMPVKLEDTERTPLFGETNFLNLDILADKDQKGPIVSQLRSLVTVYEQWINAREAEIADVSKEFIGQEDSIAEIAQSNIYQCREQCKRIEAGIIFLSEAKNEDVWRSFCLANEAIAESMRKARPKDSPMWRIFQLAFILIALPSTIERGHADRGVLDLIWFPTGGGKTEAYLGLSAILLFYRRIADRSGGNRCPAVLTRYTLRLLTIQQFERAATMICAANVVSGRHPEFEGADDFSIGLFVGGDATPNNLTRAKQVISGEDDNDERCTTLPIQKCPWCKSDLHIHEQSVDDQEKRLVTPCSNDSCVFHAGLPLTVVDEEIYEHPPSIVIGTVDKFAMMAWEPQMRVLFGFGGSAPDLIIQDELHLISDALGTVTALYEGAIDFLTTTTAGMAKIVGSTATIRRAEAQVRTLFNRSLAQFPPSGISAKDSFFYQVDEAENRLYVGLHCQGRSPKHSLSRLVGNVSQANLALDDNCRDPFYTLVMYFNSLRELGGALVLLEDDVPRYLGTLPLPPGQSTRLLPQKRELTSQLNQQELGEILDQLTKGIDQDQDYPAVDAVLSTNMISVGVDVGRLNAMIVNGQPKSTSEYIQASSRVGRESGSAGLVLVMYNWTRPRDRSHYERFKTFHLAFYRHVESGSVTPFASRARDRALHAALIAMARQSIDELRADSAAGNITDPGILKKVQSLAQFIVERANMVDPSERSDTSEHLEYFIEDWASAAQHIKDAGETDVFWRLPRDKKKNLKSKGRDLDMYELLKYPDDYSEDDRIPTPTSMRDVEPPTNIQLLKKQ